METQKIQEVIQNALIVAGYTVTTIEVHADSEKDVLFNIQTDGQNSALIGRNGDVLRAFQVLLKNILRGQGLLEDEHKIRIDVDSYRKNQEEHVLQMADKYAERVQNSGKDAVMPPMSPFFRRLVHLRVKEKFPNLETFSKGRAYNRAVCITSPQGSQEEEEVPTDIYAEIEF